MLHRHGRIRAVVHHRGVIADSFWSPRVETNRTVTIPFALNKCEETGRIDNFRKAGHLIPGEFTGIYYDDSDVFKVMEGAAHSLADHPDPALDQYLDGVIAAIGAAQEADGYLYTNRTINPRQAHKAAGSERWSNLQHSHELYNVGHLYEAAVAHHAATGKRTLLDIALKNAELILNTFGPGARHDPPGHQEIEIGLMKLHQTTGDERHLKLAQFFLDQRGRHDNGRASYGTYAQDHRPVIEQEEAVGHAVRALYMYSAMADAAMAAGHPHYEVPGVMSYLFPSPGTPGEGREGVLACRRAEPPPQPSPASTREREQNENAVVPAQTSDERQLAALDKLWHNVVGRKLAITGGTGARKDGEAFGEAYELPNATCYNETCAAIANIFWNHRLFLLTGQGKYLDVLERTLYNGMLAGVSLSGDRFFYVNPLSSDGVTPFNYHNETGRAAWFSCSCCPVNVARLLASLGSYVYAVDGGGVWVNLFIAGEATMDVPGCGTIRIEQRTEYPWDGRVRFTLHPKSESARFTLHVRIPGWARGKPAPSDLYRYVDDAGKIGDSITVSINCASQVAPIKDGFIAVDRQWKDGDMVELDFPMPVRRVIAHELVTEDAGRVAIERGPLVYCAEAADNAMPIDRITIADRDSFSVIHDHALLNGITKLLTSGGVMLIPYYAWNHRGPGAMAVWLHRG